MLDRTYSKITRRIVPLLLMGYIVAYLDRVNVGFAKLQMVADLQFGDAVYGFGAGIFFLGYFFFEVPSNWMLHRVGARVWIARIMMTWGLISAAMMFVSTPTDFYVLRFLLGAAEAGFFPGVILYLTQWYPSARRAQITAVFMTGIAISSVTGSVLSGWILETLDGTHGLSGWQWMFLVEALPALLLSVCIYFGLDDDIASAKWLAAEEKSLLTAELSRDAAPEQVTSFSGALRDGRVWFACLIYFCAMTGLYGISFWLPTIIADMGVERPMHIGLLAAVPYSVAAVGMVLVGRSADHRREHRWHVAVPAMLGALGLILSVMLLRQPFVALMALTVATFAVLTVPPLFWSLPTGYLRGAGAAAGIAVINSFGNLGGFASPYMVGWVRAATGSTAGGMYTVAAFLFLVAVLVIRGIPPRAFNRMRS